MKYYKFLFFFNQNQNFKTIRGAELIQELSQKRIQEQHESERKVLEKIKSKMDRIKATQKKIQGFGIKEPESHEKGILMHLLKSN